MEGAFFCTNHIVLETMPIVCPRALILAPETTVAVTRNVGTCGDVLFRSGSNSLDRVYDVQKMTLKIIGKKFTGVSTSFLTELVTQNDVESSERHTVLCIFHRTVFKASYVVGNLKVHQVYLAPVVYIIGVVKVDVRQYFNVSYLQETPGCSITVAVNKGRYQV